MACSLCYESKENLIDLDCDEAKQLYIAAILYKHFTFCFNEEPASGYICQKCWCKVDMFHQFFVQIEEIHDAYYRNEHIESNKCDTTSSDSKDFISNGNMEYFENDVPEKFDMNSPDHNVFDNVEDIHVSDGDDLSAVKLEADDTKEDSPKTKRKYKKHPKENHRCDHCDGIFVSIYRLRKHVKENHPELSFECSNYHCSASFSSAARLEQHRRKKHGKISCTQCGKMILANGMKKHIKQVHEVEGMSSHLCHLCGRSFNSIFMHRYHIRAEHEVHERLQCDICKEWYKNKENLRSHMKSIHVEGPKTCNICGKVSTNMKALSKHKKIHLEGSKERFKCVVCNKGFRDRTKLKEHGYIHTGITDAYVCQFCGKAFRFGSSMYAHRKKAHEQEMIALKCT